MGSITRGLSNNITTGGVILPAGITNDSVSAVTSFANASAGTLTLLSTQTASASANISFTTGLDSTYDEYINRLGSVLITPPVWLVLAVNWLPNEAVEAKEPLAVPPASVAIIYRSSSIYSGLYSPIFLSSSVLSRFYRILFINISESYYFAKFKLSPSIYTLSTLNKSKTELFGNQALPFVASPSASGILNEKQNSVSAMLIYLPTTDDYS